jgi:hypothetical protein
VTPFFKKKTRKKRDRNREKSLLSGTVTPLQWMPTYHQLCGIDATDRTNSSSHEASGLLTSDHSPRNGQTDPRGRGRGRDAGSPGVGFSSAPRSNDFYSEGQGAHPADRASFSFGWFVNS